MESSPFWSKIRFKNYIICIFLYVYRKVFDNIDSLELDIKENVTALVSAEGQVMQVKNCQPKGEIEEWLILIEDTMIAQLKSTHKNNI